MTKLISIVISSYNEEEGVLKFWSTLRQALVKLADINFEEKRLRYLAAGIFFMALLLNVKFTLDSPYFISGSELIAQTTGTGTGTGSETYTCTSGGPGSTSCSVSFDGGGGGVTGGTSCSVTCIPGYYACCNAYHNKCQCRPY